MKLKWLSCSVRSVRLRLSTNESRAEQAVPPDAGTLAAVARSGAVNGSVSPNTND
jgi:hypothetical protein